MIHQISRFRLALALGLTLCGSAAAAPLNLLTNGSFEQGTLGIGSFQGWQTTLSDVNTFVDSNGQTGTQYGQATDGLWAAYFGSPAASGGSTISQTFATVAGQTYSLSFDLANSNGGSAPSNSFIVNIGGVPVFTANNLADQNFVHDLVSFQATGTSTTLSLGGYNDQGYNEIDNVVVQSPVPEPSSLLLLATGLFGCTGVIKAKRTARQ